VSTLVTGAQGFIGSRLAERLLERGDRVIALRRDVDPESRFASENIGARCVIVLADLSDHGSLVRVLNEHQVTTVFHLAAQAVVGTARRSPLSTWEANVRGTYTLLEACREHDRLRRIVVASSDKAYGDHERLPYREDFPLQARYPYDVSKACADLIARSYAATYQLPVAVTRLANVYGPGDLNWSRLVPDTVRALARGERPIVRSGGGSKRDYLYVDDAVDVYLAVADSLDEPELYGLAWNAGSGEPVAAIDIVRRLIAIAGLEVEPDVRDEGVPAGEIALQFLDSSAIRTRLGWTPRWELERGLRSAWEWYAGRLST
jgi:CDP-glucose 4,6-dehydratase